MIESQVHKYFSRSFRGETRVSRRNNFAVYRVAIYKIRAIIRVGWFRMDATTIHNQGWRRLVRQIRVAVDRVRNRGEIIAPTTWYHPDPGIRGGMSMGGWEAGNGRRELISQAQQQIYLFRLLLIIANKLLKKKNINYINQFFMDV